MLVKNYIKFFAVLSTLSISCGKNDSAKLRSISLEQADDNTTEDSQDSLATIWVASNTVRAIAGYSSQGKYLGHIDMSHYLSTGSITSLTFYNKDTLLATIDPGNAAEKIVRIDLKDNHLVSINPNWYQDSINLNNVTTYKIVKWSDSKLLAIKNSTSIEGIAYSMDTNIATRLGYPFIGTGLTGDATCMISTMQYAIPVTFNGNTKLLGFSSGVNTRINLYEGLDTSITCNSSINYSTGSITPISVPTGAAQLGNGKVYVRFQSAAESAIVSYDYNGNSLSNPVTVFNDSSFLNNSNSDRDLVALDESTLLFSNWATDSVNLYNTETKTASYFIKDLFTQDVNAIGIRPLH